MRHQFSTLIFIFFPLLFSTISAQNEGYTSTCAPQSPLVQEIMIDACGDEFRSEYVLLRAQDHPFDVRLYGMECRNPLTNAFIGATTIQDNSVNQVALQRLNAAGTAACAYGPVFKDIFSPPYNGVLPPQATLLVFNNRDSTDVGFLGTRSFEALCGSTVFVAFGTLRSQSPGQSVFRNYPPNGRCSSGCIRTIAFRFGGENSAYCTFFNYDYSHLPHLNTTNPPEGFGEGSYIRPHADGRSLVYGGGNLDGRGQCMPPLSMQCQIPNRPPLDTQFWRVSVFDGLNTTDMADFKGYYKAFLAATAPSKWTWDTANDGWPLSEGPHLALATMGAAQTYQGCNVRPDSFSILAEKKGFPCGYYMLKLTDFDTFTRIRIDPEGQGVWSTIFLQNAVLLPPDSVIWRGYLGPASQLTFFASNTQGIARLSCLFIQDERPPLSILPQKTQAACWGQPTGQFLAAVQGGFPPFQWAWSAGTSTDSTAAHLPAGAHVVSVTDAVGCTDTLHFNILEVNDFQGFIINDTLLCRPDTLSLFGGANGGWGGYVYDWGLGFGSNMVHHVEVDRTRSWYLHIKDSSGCVWTDSVLIEVVTTDFSLQIAPENRVCMGTAVRLRAPSGLTQYSWRSQPQIDFTWPETDTVQFSTAGILAGDYRIYAEATDSFGCLRTAVTTLGIEALPDVVFLSIPDTVCLEQGPLPLFVRPEAGRFTVLNASNAVENNLFFPERAGIGRFELLYEAVNVAGCVGTARHLLTVKQCICPTPPRAFIRAPERVCDATSIQLFGQVTDAPDLLWRTFGNGQLDDNQVPDPIYRVDSLDRRAGQVCFSLTALDPDGSGVCEATSDTACVALLVGDYRSQSQSICRGEVWVWQGDTLREAGNYRHTYTNRAGCDSIETLQLSVLPLDTVEVYETTCDSAAAGRRVQHYTRLNRCDSVVIRHISLQRRDFFAENDTVCRGTSYQWQQQYISETGVYRRLFQNEFGCDSVRQLSLVVWPTDTTYVWKTSCNPRKVGIEKQWLRNQWGCDSVVSTQTILVASDMIVTCQQQASVRCFGDKTARLEAKVVSGGQAPFRFQWDDGPEAPAIEGLGAGSYRLRVTDALGCTVITDWPVTQPASLALSAVAIPPACESLQTGSIRLDSVTGGAPPYEVRVAGQSFGIPAWPFSLHFLRVGTYQLELKDRHGCLLHQDMAIVPAPHVSIGLPDIIEMAIGDTIRLMPQLPFVPQQVRWQPSVGLSCDTCLFPILRATEAQTYKLRVYDTSGCTYDAHTNVRVDKTANWFIPTAFSPNNDGENDVFMIFSDDKLKKVHHFSIYDRWGNRVFFRLDSRPNLADDGWDGRLNGDVLSQDVYVYKAVLELIDGRLVEIAGDVFLKKE